MNKLTLLTAERIDCILDDTIQSLNSICCIPLHKDNEFAESYLNIELVDDALQKQWRQEQKIIEKRRSNGLHATYGVLTGDREQLRETTRQLSRTLKTSQDATKKISCRSEASPHVLGILIFLRDLRKNCFAPYSMTSEEEEKSIKRERALREKQRKSLLENESITKALRTCQGDPEVGHLEKRLRRLRINVESETRMMEEMDTLDSRATEEKSNAQRCIHDNILMELTDERVHLTHNFRQIKDRNKAIEDELRKQMNSAETSLANLEGEYQQIIAGKRKKIENMLAIAESDEIELKHLQEHFDRIDRNNRIAQEEEEILAAVLEMEEAASEVMNEAAKNFQRIFRGRRDRQDTVKLKLKLKKSKAGKGKGKGKAVKGTKVKRAKKKKK